MGIGTAGVAQWNSYRKKRLMAVDIRMSNFRLWMETRREHVYAGNSSNKKAIDTEVSSDMERLRSVRIHWDFGISMTFTRRLLGLRT